MQFHPCTLHDVRLIQLEPVRDHRGFFARTFCADEFSAHGLETEYPQHSVSYSARKGAVRGMHFQREPHGEVKLVRCQRGAIWDVIIDIRPESPTYRRWEGFDLTAAGPYELYIPKGFAHGFQALTDDVEVSYHISVRHAPQAAAGIRYDDPRFGIAWRLPVVDLSEKDRSWPDFAG
jgi:dTDP-4-dehydrorhamnose 3,5-epimerase